MPRKAKPKMDHTILEMALVGYQAELAKVTAAISGIQAQLGHRGPGRPKAVAAEAHPAAPAVSAAKKRTMSASARARIAAAQRARWAAVKQTKPAPKKAKRTLSAAGRKAIIEATRKRWEAFHKAQKAASKPKAAKKVAAAEGAGAAATA